MDLSYSPSRKAFFDARVHATVPADAVTVSAAEHAALLAARSAGKVIEMREGRPVGVAPSVPIEARRARAVAAAKAEAARRILAIASLTRQSNDNALIAQFAINLAMGTDGDAAANVEANAALDRRHRIDAIRAASDAMEATIATMTARALAALDVSAAARWPTTKD